jgi:DHA2 family multidrug resistance protein
MTAVATAAPAPPVQKVGLPLYLGFGGMVLGQFMAFLDIQIVAASLPQIQAGVGATADEISWVQTAYIIPEVVMIPLAAYLSRLWGTRPVFVMSAIGFTGASVLCGFSTSIEMMIVTRALQGFLGGAMVPTVFATAFTAFPPEKRIGASTMIGMVVTMAPTLGPSLGGWITEALDWRWLFFVNVIPCAAVIALVWRYGDFDKGDPSLAKGFDWWGLGAMAVFLMSMQFVFEEGPGELWFDSEAIVLLAATAVLMGMAFVFRSLSYANPIIDFRVFANRNFLIGLCFTFVMGVNMFGAGFLMPLFLGRVGGLPAGEIGLIMGVSGLAAFVSAPLCQRLAKVLDPRAMMVGGMVVSFWGLWDAHALTPEWGMNEFMLIQILRSFGMFCAMVGSQQIAMASLPPHLVKNASGLMNLSRNVGGALGLALLSTIIGQGTRGRTIEMSARMSTADPQAQEMLSGLVQRMEAMGVADPEGAARKAMTFMVEKQAMTIEFGRAFAVLAIIAAIAGVVALFARPVAAGAVAQPAEAH